MPRMLPGKVSEVCPNTTYSNVKGAVMADYQPRGKLETIHGRETYVARPNGQPKGIVIIIPDAFGLPFINNKHLADRYASDGQFLTYLPDFMDGRPAPQWMLTVFPEVMNTASLWNWIVKPYYVVQALYGFVPFIYYNGFAKSMPRVTSFFEAVRDNEGANLGIGCAGFCWGGQHTFAFASGEYKSKKSGRVLCDAHFTAHASNVKIPDDAKKVTMPLSVAQGTKDAVMTTEQAKEVEAILREKADKIGLKHSEVIYYEGAAHGFGVRADAVWGNKKSKEHAEASIKQAIDFYNRVFADLK